MANLFHRKAWLFAFFGAGTAFTVFLGGRQIALDNAGAINKALNISTTVRDGEGPDYFPADYGKEGELKAKIKSIAEEVESEGLVLLENKNNALPLLSSEKKVSLIGTASYNFNYNTSGSSSTSSSNYPSLKEVLEENDKFVVDTTLASFYASADVTKNYGRYEEGSVYKIREVPFANLPALDNYGDVAIVTLARNSGEGKDLSTANSDGEDGSYLSLSEEELGLLQELTIKKGQGKLGKIIVLLNSSNPIEVDFLYRAGIDVDATLWVGNVGAYGIRAIPKVLTGEVNPSGRLSDTYCRDAFSSPAMASWALNRGKLFSQGYTNYSAAGCNETNRSYGVYNEGIYVGYRYYETRFYDQVAGDANVGEFDYDAVVGFPFGHGLSYASFSYSSMTLEEEASSYKISVTVKNDSPTYSGKHAVQVYLSKPYTAYDKENGVEKSAVELVGFGKTALLAPNASETVSVSVPKEALKSYDANKAKTYIVEEGDYSFAIGLDAHVATKNVLAAAGLGAGDANLVKKVHISAFDDKTYAVSRQSKTAITNQLDHADPNKYEGLEGESVVYVSRSNWVNTFPAAKNSLSVATDKMKEDLTSHHAFPDTGEAMPKYNQATELTAADARGAEFTDSKWDSLVDALSYQDQALLVTNGQFTTSVMGKIGLPESFAADGPTAVTDTKTESSFPSEGIWASTFDLDLIERLGEAFALDARYAEIQGLYAPGVNIHRAPFIGRSNEYFSEDAFLTGAMAASEIKGMQSKGVLAHVKHFAFNDEETNRNGICIWLNEQQAREILLLPFEMACSEDGGNAHAVMSSFNRIGCVWAGADRNAQINILQKEWGYDGYIITDMAASNAANYMVYDDGIYNGSSLFLGTGSREALDAYKDSPAFANMLRDAAKRIIYNVTNYSAAMNGVSGKVGEQVPWYQMLLTGLTIGTGVITGACLALSLVSLFKDKKKQD